MISFMKIRIAGSLLGVGLAAAVTAAAAAVDLQISVYCTAGDIQQHLMTDEGRQRVLSVLQPLGAARLFLEGRRGDEYVAPEVLKSLRAFFAVHHIECSGGIATVPGANFGVRQQGELGWLNWESSKTRFGVAQFFRENAPIFDELIVDDFYCTGDVSPVSATARGDRAWGDYRRDLLVSLMKPMIFEPTKQARRQTRLIVKFPQWYDRFHLFGYDPPRMAAPFDEVWVGAEVRNPATRRMGFVQPTEGYMNFRWITAIAGAKVRGAWFDHIECSAQNFVDQAYQSVLAGARELTLFHLGDLVASHPGDASLADRLPELRDLAAGLRNQKRRGVAFYKPAGSESDDNMYLADYLGMLGLPILPVAKYPGDAKVAVLPVQAAHDQKLPEQARRHLERGATLVVTPALLRKLGAEFAGWAGVQLSGECKPVQAESVTVGGNTIKLNLPLEMDGGLKADRCAVLLSASAGVESLPLLTRHAVGRGQLWMLNVRTFSEADFGLAGEWLLSPRLLGLPALPEVVVNELRHPLLEPLKLELQAPTQVSLVLAGRRAWFYSFRDEPTRLRFNGREHTMPAHGLWPVR